jgi:hypothetical protein
MKNLSMWLRQKQTNPKSLKKKSQQKSNPKTPHEFKDKMKQRGQCHKEQFATENLHSDA